MLSCLADGPLLTWRSGGGMVVVPIIIRVGAQCMLSGVLNEKWIIAMGNRGNALWDSAGWPRPSWARPAGGCWTGGYSLAHKLASKWSADVPFSPSCVKDTHCAGECVFANHSHWPTCTPALLSSVNGPAACCSGSCGNYVGTGATPKVTLPQSMGAGEALVMAGGFSHIEDTAEVWMLKDTMAWQQLPSLPYPMSTPGLASVGSKLFAVGGGGSKATVWAKVNGTERGRKVWVLDLAQTSPAWVAGPDLPGTPRSSGVVIAVNHSVYALSGEADPTGSPYSARLMSSKSPPMNCSGLNPGVSLATCRATVLDSWVLDTTTMKWSRLPNNDFVRGGMSPSAVVVHDRWILNLGVDCADGSAGNIENCVSGTGPGCTLKANFPIGATTINTTCLKIPPPESSHVGYCNGVSVFDTAEKKWGAVRTKSTSHGAALMGPPGCPQERGLPFNCFSPNVAVKGDEVLIHSGECSPFQLNGINRWHYPTTALSAKVSPLSLIEQGQPE